MTSSEFGTLLVRFIELYDEVVAVLGLIIISNILFVVFYLLQNHIGFSLGPF